MKIYNTLTRNNKINDELDKIRARIYEEVLDFDRYKLTGSIEVTVHITQGVINKAYIGSKSAVNLDQFK